MQEVLIYCMPVSTFTVSRRGKVSLTLCTILLISLHVVFWHTASHTVSATLQLLHMLWFWKLTRSLHVLIHTFLIQQNSFFFFFLLYNNLSAQGQLSDTYCTLGVSVCDMTLYSLRLSDACMLFSFFTFELFPTQVWAQFDVDIIRPAWGIMLHTASL